MNAMHGRRPAQANIHWQTVDADKKVSCPCRHGLADDNEGITMLVASLASEDAFGGRKERRRLGHGYSLGRPNKIGSSRPA